VRALEPAAPGQAHVQNTSSTHGFAPNMAPGIFVVYLSVGQRDGTPRIALPIDGHDGHRRYKLGTMEITP